MKDSAFGRGNLCQTWKVDMNIKDILTIVVGALLLMAAGCQGPETTNKWDKISRLENERANLTAKVLDLEGKNEQLTQQIGTLAKFDRELRFDIVSNLDRVVINKRSGFFDKDDDGKEETLIVYVTTYDDSGDVVKTTGDINLQLWDLSKEPQEALLCQWDVAAKELKQLWMGMMMTNYFRLPYKVAGLVDESQKEYTIRIKFVDYLTGKIFQEQMVISSN
jgi:hypothetical protein